VLILLEFNLIFAIARRKNKIPTMLEKKVIIRIKFDFKFKFFISFARIKIIMMLNKYLIPSYIIPLPSIFDTLSEKLIV